MRQQEARLGNTRGVGRLALAAHASFIAVVASFPTRVPVAQRNTASGAGKATITDSWLTGPPCPR